NEVDKHVHADKGGRALLFENVKGSDIPVAINTFGSYWRMEQALGTPSLEDLAQRVGRMVKPEMPAGFIEKLKMGKEMLGDLMSLRPKRRETGPCQEVVHQGDKVDLTRLPIIQCWPLDGDLSSGQVFEEHDPSPREAGMARGQGFQPDPGERQNGQDALATPRDASARTGRYITFGGIYTKNPENGDR